MSTASKVEFQVGKLADLVVGPGCGIDARPTVNESALAELARVKEDWRKSNERRVELVDRCDGLQAELKKARSECRRLRADGDAIIDAQRSTIQQLNAQLADARKDAAHWRDAADFNARKLEEVASARKPTTNVEDLRDAAPVPLRDILGRLDNLERLIAKLSV